MFEDATKSLCAVALISSHLLCGCGLWEHASTGNGEQKNVSSADLGAPQLTVIRVVPNSGTISDQMSPSQAVETLRSNMRPMPDKRFLGAIAMLHSIITNQKTTPVTVTFEDGMWNISYAGLQAGRIREFADTNDFCDCLASWYKQVAAKYNFQITHSPIADSKASTSSNSTAGYTEIKKGLDRFTPRSLIDALSLANDKWKGGDRSDVLVSMSAEALASLTFLTMDRVQLYDEITSRALALVAMSENVGGKPLFRERCLLSTTMCYEGAAKKQACMLPKSDPIRMMIEGRSDALQLAARPATAPPLTKMCNLLLLSRLRQADRWRADANAWLMQSDGAALPILKSYEDLVPIQGFVSWGSYLVGTTLHEVDEKNSHGKGLNIEDLVLIDETVQRSTSWFSNDIIERLDNSLARAPAAGTGPFIDEGCASGFYRGYFYTGIRYLRESGQQLEKIADVLCKSTDRLTKCMGHFFKEYAESRAARASNRQSAQSSSSYFEDPDKVNMLPATFYFEYMLRRTNAQHSNARMRWLLERVDARPENIFFLSQIATNDRDLALADRLIEAACNLGWTKNIARSWLDTLSDPRMTIDVRLNLIKSLRAKGVVSSKQVENICRKMSEHSPSAWSSAEPLVTVYYDENRIDDAKRLVAAWLKKNEDKQHVDETMAKTVLAYLLLNSGHPEEALAALGDKASTGKFECMRAKVLILEKLGRFKEAEEWAKEALKRYESINYPIELILLLYWRNGRYADAAGIFVRNGSRQGLRHADIGHSFSEALSGKPQEELTKATEALVAQGVTGWNTLGVIAQTVAAMGDHKKAFELMMRCKVPPAREPERLLSAYKELKLAKGDEYGRDWLAKQVAPQHLTIILRQAFLQRCFELLWSMTSQDGATNDQLWLWRAAAYIDSEQKDKDAEKGKLLTAHYAKPGKTFEHQIGQFLMDAKGGKDLLKRPLNLVQLCVCSYYIGLHDLNARPSYSATDWFRLTKETGLGAFESQLSNEKLNDILDQTVELELGIAFSLPRPRPVYDKHGRPIYFAFARQGRLRSN